MRQKYLSNQKLWSISKQRDQYFYELKLAGTIIERIPIPEESIYFLQEHQLIKNDDLTNSAILTCSEDS